MNPVRVTTETVKEVIYRYINECGENRFTTTDISRMERMTHVHHR